MLQGKILTPTKRIRRTPFSSKIEDQVKGVTVYNHMILPTIFKDAEEDCRHLKSEVQVWDVSVQRQVEIVGKDAATLLELLTPRNVKDMNPNKCLYAPMVNQNGGMINDPVLLRVDEDRYWISIADSDVLLWVSGIAAALKLNVEVSEPSVAPLAIQGPKSRLLMKRIFGNEMDYFSYFDLRKLKFGKHTINVARTGWSKQGGFEIYVEGSIYAEDLSVSIPESFNLPEKPPSKSALSPSRLPFITPVLPTTIFPEVLMFPLTFPSILKSPSLKISPTTVVPCETIFC